MAPTNTPLFFLKSPFCLAISTKSECVSSRSDIPTSRRLTNVSRQPLLLIWVESRVLLRIFRNCLTRPCGHILAKRASISGHDSGSRRRDEAGERIMPAQRVWKTVGPVKSDAEIEHLRLELASFNERIEELEKQHPDASKIEALKTSALVLARQIDEIRCSSANELIHLLAK